MSVFIHDDDDDLEQLRANLETEHAAVMAAADLTIKNFAARNVIEREAPQLLYRTTENARVAEPTNVSVDEPDEAQVAMLEAVADAIYEESEERRTKTVTMIDDAVAPLRERLAKLEGSLEMLTLLLSNNGAKSIEESAVVRKLRFDR